MRPSPVENPLISLDVGPKTCRDGRPGSGGHYGTSPSFWPSLTRVLVQDANTFASWGVDMVKMDFCNRPDGPAEKWYGIMRDALNQTGRKIAFNMCEWGREEVWTWGNKTGNTWRVGPDHLPLWWTW